MSSVGNVKGFVRPGTNKLEANVDGFDLIIDYPVEGYEPEGPVPGAMVAFGLAGCKALVCAMYFNGRNKNVTVGVEVSLDGGREEGKGSFFANFKVALTFSGDVEEADLAKIEKILDNQCAVEHILLSKNNTVETTYSIG